MPCIVYAGKGASIANRLQDCSPHYSISVSGECRVEVDVLDHV